ncbi:MAG: hypothetical protein ABI700_16000 [Chloroflexota bacterium]
MSTRLEKVFPYWPPIFVGLLVVISLLYVRLSQLPVDQGKIEYGLVLLYRNTAFYLVLVALIGFVVLMGYLVRMQRRISRSRDIIYALSIILIAFVAIPLTCWSTQFLFVEFGASFVHLDRTTLNSELYQLAYIGQPAYGKSSYNLYRCDSLGISCDRLYQVDTSTGMPHADLGNFKDAQTAHIVSDDTQNHLSIVVGAASIGDYSPEQKPPT